MSSIAFTVQSVLNSISLPASPTAYIDPNTGGMLFQMLAVILALFSGIIFFFSRQIKTGFARLRRRMRGIPEPKNIEANENLQTDTSDKSEQES
jgi:hypothetical protein